MADETKSETADKPLANLAGTERALEPPVTASDSHLADPHAYTLAFKDAAPDRLRAFEDEHLGKDAVRIGGQIERGYGSRFRDQLTDEQRRQHAALEKLVAAEQKLAAAHAALIQAETDHEAALAAAEPKPDGRGPTVEEWVAAGYRAINYPPGGYESRSTREEIDAAIEKQKADAGK